MSHDNLSRDRSYGRSSSRGTIDDRVHRNSDPLRRQRTESTASETSVTTSTKFSEDDAEDGFADNDDVQSGPVPHWQRVLAASRVGRQEHSRASSVMSCRTRLTVSTDDARSIEFEAGGRSFRINRYGSSVADVTAPPPYPGPPLEEVTEASDEEDAIGSSDRASIDTTRRISRETSTRASMDVHDLSIRTHQPDDALHGSESTSSSRVGNVLELPQRIKSMLAMRWNSGTSIEDNHESNSRLNVLRRTQSESSTLGKVRTYLSDDSKDDGNLDEAVFLEAQQQLHDLKLDDGTVPDTPPAEDQFAGSLLELKHEYRRKLHDRDIELAQMRSLLDEKDKVLRQQLRERDFAIETAQNELEMKDKIINDLKTKVYEMDDDVERRIEQARNEVEDTWEKRWKEYEHLLLTRIEARNFDAATPSKVVNSALADAARIHLNE